MKITEVLCWWYMVRVTFWCTRNPKLSGGNSALERLQLPGVTNRLCDALTGSRGEMNRLEASWVREAF